MSVSHCHPSTVVYLSSLTNDENISSNILAKITTTAIILPWHVKYVLASDDELANKFFTSIHNELPITIKQETKVVTMDANYEFARGLVLTCYPADVTVSMFGYTIDYHLFEYPLSGSYYIVLRDVKYYFESEDFLLGALFVGFKHLTFSVHSYTGNLPELLANVKGTLAWERSMKINKYS